MADARQAATAARRVSGALAEAPAEPTDVGLPPPVLQRAVKAVLVLEELQRLRLVNDGETGEALWQRAAGEVDAWVEGGLG